MSKVVQLDPRAIARARVQETTGAIGMMMALAAWGMMFAALFFVYLGLRAQAKSWPPPGLSLPLALPLVNTVVMVASSLTLKRALERLRSGERVWAVRWMTGTFALGIAFVGLQCLLWIQLWSEGIRLNTGIVGAVTYALTTLHAFHVVGGIAVLGYLLAVAMRGGQLHRRTSTLRYCGMYWHFVDAVWLLMFVGMFLL
ncbi:MAG: heme-copper oxidase subunit III [Deltaproteobacteria bacterium]|nr:heme-copper oxidase subunit III [Deltaproteobacteria bacterium]